ncbi:MAG: bL28 family ribosomal protein [Candidatus Berkelbacteria bacterium]|nr:bL28 family ribosomal protein [Candidatus Berkelbacteria bacterium]
MGGCYICQRRKSFGQNVSHSKRRTKRAFKANLHKVRIQDKTKLVCSRCLKKMDYCRA